MSSNCPLFICYNETTMNNEIPQHITQSFPQLDNAHFLRRLASPVPLVPDTIFNIYVNNSQTYFALVATDYIDLEAQRNELTDISGANEFKIMSIVRPLNATGDPIDTTKIDNYDIDWSISYNGDGAYPTYYYLAELSTNH